MVVSSWKHRPTSGWIIFGKKIINLEKSHFYVCCVSVQSPGFVGLLGSWFQFEFHHSSYKCIKIILNEFFFIKVDIFKNEFFCNFKVVFREKPGVAHRYYVLKWGITCISWDLNKKNCMTPRACPNSIVRKCENFQFFQISGWFFSKCPRYHINIFCFSVSEYDSLPIRPKKSMWHPRHLGKKWFENWKI